MSATKNMEKSSIPTQDVSNFNDKGMIDTHGQYNIVLLYSDGCGHCVNASKVYHTLKGANFYVSRINVDDISETDIFKIFPDFTGGVPHMAMYDKQGKYIGEYTDNINKGCGIYKMCMLSSGKNCKKC